MENIVLDVNVVLLVSAVVVVALIALVVYLNSRVNKLEKKYIELILDAKGNNIEELLMKKLSDVNKVKKDMDELNLRYAEMRHKLSSCIQKVGIIRYNAFEDMGSDLSFAISLLDEKNDGVVFSSTYGREDFRCYAKPVVGGKSEYNFSKEEEKLIANSMK